MVKCLSDWTGVGLAGRPRDDGAWLGEGRGRVRPPILNPRYNRGGVKGGEGFVPPA